MKRIVFTQAELELIQEALAQIEASGDSNQTVDSIQMDEGDAAVERYWRHFQSAKAKVLALLARRRRHGVSR